MTDTLSLKTRLESGGKRNPFWFCGPCVIEDRDVLGRVAERLKAISEKHRIPVVFKASFDKANRTSYESFRGRGVEEGLRELAWVKKEFELPILTDIHETAQARPVAEVADILQIPAFLCRQTDLIEAACRTGRLVNLKKGQFLSPANVAQLVGKLRHFDAAGFWITERGVSFGYQRLIVISPLFPKWKRREPRLSLISRMPFSCPGHRTVRVAGFGRPSHIWRARVLPLACAVFSRRLIPIPHGLCPMVRTHGPRPARVAHVERKADSGGFAWRVIS